MNTSAVNPDSLHVHVSGSIETTHVTATMSALMVIYQHKLPKMKILFGSAQALEERLCFYL